MTYNEAREILIDRLTRVGNNRISGPDVLEAALLLLDQSSGVDNAEILPLWTALLTFNADGTGAGKFCRHPDNTGKIRIFESKINNNINIAPPTDPGVIETASWREQSPAAASAIKEWAAGLYGAGLQIVYFEENFLLLTDPARPFQSVDISAEILTGKWKFLTRNHSVVNVNTAGNTVVLNMGRAKQRSFAPTATIDEAATWSITNGQEGEQIIFPFVLNANCAQTMPNDWVVFSQFWNNVTKIFLNPADNGQYLLVGEKVGASWYMTIHGPML